MDELMAPVSPGELIDKLTILDIKSRRITAADKLANVRIEYEALTRCWAESIFGGADIAADQAALLAVNERLWEIEDLIRDQERARLFDEEFIRLARAVYIENDQRAAIKKRINQALGSRLVEEKSYAAY